MIDSPSVLRRRLLSVLRRRLLSALLVLIVLGTALLTGCEREPDPTTYVARVGDMVLTDDKVEAMLSGLPPNVDTAEARQQVVEQWVTRSLLLKEAERINLREDPTVQRRIREQERSILVTALTDRMYTEAELAPSEAEVRTFFQSNRGQMALREPFARVRHLSTDVREEADSARTALQEAATAGRSLDSTFAALIDEYAAFPEQARRLTAKFVPASRLFGHRPYVRDELMELGDGEIAPVVEDDRLFHVLQLVERIPEGSEPELAWVEEEIRRRLTIRSRKQMYAREVQRLRNQALAQDDLQFGTLDGETTEETVSDVEATGQDTTAPEPDEADGAEPGEADGALEGTGATPSAATANPSTADPSTADPSPSDPSPAEPTPEDDETEETDPPGEEALGNEESGDASTSDAETDPPPNSSEQPSTDATPDRPALSGNDTGGNDTGGSGTGGSGTNANATASGTTGTVTPQAEDAFENAPTDTTGGGF